MTNNFRFGQLGKGGWRISEMFGGDQVFQRGARVRYVIFWKITGTGARTA